MRLLGRLRRWIDWNALAGIITLYRKRPELASALQDYFVQWYGNDPEPFAHGMFLFVAGYSTAYPYEETYLRIQKADPDKPMERIVEQEYLDALKWMDKGIQEISSSIRWTSKREVRIYACLLKELSCFLDSAGAAEDALRCLEDCMELGRQYTPEDICGEHLDRLQLLQALYLAHAERYEEAIRLYPSKRILHAIATAKSRGQTPGAIIDILPYVQIIIDSAQDPNSRCGSEDLEYAHRMLSEFYYSTGSYADMVAINLKDIFGDTIGEKKNRNAVIAHLHFAIGAYHGDLMEFVKPALSKAYRMAVEVLDPSVDSEASLFYQIYFYYFQIYMQEPELKKAGDVLNQAMDFLNERLERQRTEKGDQAVIALVDVEAREQLLQCEAELFSVQGDPVKALERSDWVVESRRKRRQRREDGCTSIFDPFYLEDLSVNTLYQLQANHGRTPRSDGQIREMLQEIVHIAEDLKLITLDNARQDTLCDMQTWANFIFSYWVEFSDHCISTEELYQFELNTKNIDPYIRLLQNRALQGCHSSQSDAFCREQREFREDYQKAAFESSGFQTNQERFLNQQMALDIKRYQLLKKSKYEFTYCELRVLQQRLSRGRAVLEFRKFINYHLFPDASQPISSEHRYGAFLITGDYVDFKLLGGAEEIEQAVSALLEDIQDTGMMDVHAVSAAKLHHVEEELLGPFRETLAQMKELYIVPDDELYRVPFELMPVWNAKDSQKGDSVGIKICYLTTAQSILKEPSSKGSYRSIRIIADPQFRIEDGGMETTVREDDIDIEANLLEPVRSALHMSGISSLKYTGLEAECIEKVFTANHGTVELVRGREARKDNVFTTRTDILHFATHGFTILTQVQEDAQEAMYSPRVKQIKASDNALLRCGLLLSGVDNWLCGVEARGFGNGILTGMDILSENLMTYQLVVLSACNTGQGVVPYSGEGIEGLRSAFELAGVPMLICTLWKVDDFPTALFMAEFYQEMQRGCTPLLALYTAKLMLRDISYAELERRGFQAQADGLFEKNMPLSKEEKPFAHPRYWAGFILHGAAFGDGNKGLSSNYLNE